MARVHPSGGWVSGSPTVVYIVGVQNCGSTLLDAILGSAPGARSLGEAGGFFRHQIAPRCDCGEVGASCGPCRSVLQAWTERDQLDRMAEVFPLPARGRCLHWTLLSTKRRRDYAALSDVQYRAAAEATGASVLIDSSKNVGRAAAVLLDGDHDVRLVHLVRDPRGHLRSRRDRQRHSRIREGSVAVFVRWLVKNAVISTILRRRAGSAR